MLVCDRATPAVTPLLSTALGRRVLALLLPAVGVRVSIADRLATVVLDGPLFVATSALLAL